MLLLPAMTSRSSVRSSGIHDFPVASRARRRPSERFSAVGRTPHRVVRLQANNPFDYIRYTNELRQDLIAAGFPKIPLVNSEWGYELFKSATPQQLAAFMSA